MPRLAGTINYPTPKKIERGHVPELMKLEVFNNAPPYKAEHLTKLAGPSRRQRSRTEPMPEWLMELVKTLRSDRFIIQSVGESSTAQSAGSPVCA